MKIKKTAVIIAILGFVLFYCSIGCPFRFLTGISCPGCGMSRAALSFISLDFAEAFYFHPMVFTMPAFAVLILAFRRHNKKLALVFGILCLSLGIVYLYRLFFDTAPDIVYKNPEEGIIYKLIRSVFYVS